MQEKVPEMNEERYAEIVERLGRMSREQRADLDPIARAINDYRERHSVRDGGRCLANRIDALAAVDQCEEIERMIASRT